ncbi:hypothetical protein BS78_08G113700 [Paspalum vaginatum]|nr:hypothetical protein BS78_08G113700 [Paspalum vaginatum]
MMSINANGGILSYEKMEGYALWVATGVASAFFATTAATTTPEEAKDRPLMFSRPQALPEYYYDRSGSSASFAKM